MRPGYQEQILYILNKHHSIVTVELGDAVTDDILQLIDSAKLEGAEEERKKWNTAAEEALSILKETTKYVERTIAQLEQSKESE